MVQSDMSFLGSFLRNATWVTSMTLDSNENETPAALPKKFLTYVNVPWKLMARKEVFSPLEIISDPAAMHITFCQIVRDVLGHSSVRVCRTQKQDMKILFG